MNTDSSKYKCTPSPYPDLKSADGKAVDKEKIVNDMESMIGGQSADIRYVVVHNKTSDTIYPALQLRNKDKQFIMDKQAPGDANIPTIYFLFLLLLSALAYIAISETNSR